MPVLHVLGPPLQVSPQEGIHLPFQLPEGTANEGQFAFSVDSVSMAQRLRGTLTYMLMVSLFRAQLVGGTRLQSMGIRKRFPAKAQHPSSNQVVELK